MNIGLSDHEMLNTHEEQVIVLHVYNEEAKLWFALRPFKNGRVAVKSYNQYVEQGKRVRMSRVIVRHINLHLLRDSQDATNAPSD